MIRRSTALAAILLILLLSGHALAATNNAESNATEDSGEGITFAQEFDHPCERYTLDTIKLRKIMEEIKKIYADDPMTLRRIIKAQSAWDSYVTWHVKALYGGPESYGSAADTCNCVNMIPVVELRLQQLRYWRDGTFEGDSCAGHVKWLKKE